MIPKEFKITCPKCGSNNVDIDTKNFMYYTPLEILCLDCDYGEDLNLEDEVGSLEVKNND